MSFDWAEFLVLAEELLRDLSSHGSEEACLRTAISRAYYAAFRSALNRESSNGAFCCTGFASDHTELPKHFQGLPDPALRKVGIDLDRLRLYRRQADYQDELGGDLVRTAKFSVTTARNILAALNSP